MKHIFAIQQTFSNAKEHGLPFSLSFIDLKNTFGSVSHQYILDMLSHVNVPAIVHLYISNLYSSLSAYISTKDWSTANFQIEKGAFQGDTLSPLLFLLAFNPILQVVYSYPACGFKMVIEKEQYENLAILPAVGSFIYALWDEMNSSEAHGWYLAKISSFIESQEPVLLYKSGGRSETVSLADIKWAPAKGNGKWFLPPTTTFPSLTSNSFRLSQEHKVKGFVDDLTIPSRPLKSAKLSG